MSRKINWPDGHDFAFTVVDDTDGATVKNIKPVYDYLYKKGIITTKTCWAFPPKDDRYTGDSLQNESYKSFLLDLKQKGYEIGFHNAGSGGFTREETLKGFELFKSTFGEYPSLHINHSNNIENLYWGYKRFTGLIKLIYKLKSKRHYLGDEKNSEYFWGDFAKEHIKYIRNRTFNTLDTLKEDKRIVYKEKGKEEYANYFFSSSDGMRLAQFLKLLKKENVDSLVKNHGCAIVYTHFAYDFVDENEVLSEEFKRRIDYLASKNGWFVPAGQLLDYVLKDKEYSPSVFYQNMLDIKWFAERLFKG